jgi:hypothetical protein
VFDCFCLFSWYFFAASAARFGLSPCTQKASGKVRPGRIPFRVDVRQTVSPKAKASHEGDK